MAVEKPSRFNRDPEAWNTYLSDVMAEDARLAFYQWVGAHALRELVAGIRTAYDYNVGDGYTANSIADEYDPDKLGERLPSVLPQSHTEVDHG